MDLEKEGTDMASTPFLTAHRDSLENEQQYAIDSRRKCSTKSQGCMFAMHLLLIFGYTLAFILSMSFLSLERQPQPHGLESLLRKEYLPNHAVEPN